MNDKFASQGKVYLNGTCVQYAVPTLSKIHEYKEREYTKRTFKIGFKQRMKIYDAITLQHIQAQGDPSLYHCFLTATYRAGSVPDSPNKSFGGFLNKLQKQGFKNYVWTRELTKRGTVHYHFTTVGPKKPINASGHVWSINKCWCDSRGYYSGNAIRSSINPYTGKSQMVISSLHHARAYVSKYVAKANDDDQSAVGGRVYAVSDSLTSHPPITVQDAMAFVYGYGGRYSDKRDVLQMDFCKIGGINPLYAEWAYNQFKSQADYTENLKMLRRIEQEKAEKERNYLRELKKMQKTIDFSQSK